MTRISIAHIQNKVELARRLWEYAKPAPAPVDCELTEEELEEATSKYTIYLGLRLVKIDISKDDADTYLYDKINGNGTFKLVVDTYFPDHTNDLNYFSFSNYTRYRKYHNPIELL